MQVINTAILSYGMSGKLFHAPFIHLHHGFELVGAWERSKKVIGEKYPEAKSYLSMEELLADKSVDLVVVNTPTYTHFEYAKKSLLAGKHVVVEKAFTTTTAEAEELKGLSETAGKKITVFQNRRWDSDFKTVSDVISKGLPGELVEATISFDRFNPGLSPKLHKETPGPGAGILKDLGPHLIDQALVLFGMPLAVFGDIRITRTLSQVDDYFEILLYYPKLRARLKGGYFVREPVAAYMIHGMKGSFLKSRGDIQETQLLAGMVPNHPDYGIELEAGQGLLHTELDGKVIKEKVKSLPGSYMDYYEGVYQSISQDKPMPVTADDGIRVMKIIEAAVKSNLEKRVVEL